MRLFRKKSKQWLGLEAWYQMFTYDSTAMRAWKNMITFQGSLIMLLPLCIAVFLAISGKPRQGAVILIITLGAFLTGFAITRAEDGGLYKKHSIFVSWCMIVGYNLCGAMLIFLAIFLVV
jgi:hypothetical protein